MNSSTLSSAALDRFRRIRARTRGLFDLVEASAYYERPIPLRNPIVFYEGHLPAFAVNTLLKKALGEPAVDERLETIFARGIDPETEAAAVARGNPAWPSRDEVLAYAAEADRRLEQAMAAADLAGDHPMRQPAQALWTILEHEEMHQETLAYMWHELPYSMKRKPEGYETIDNSVHPARVDGPQAVIPPGTAWLGTAEGFAWDNERPAHAVHVPAFAIDAHDVTNAAFMAFVEAGGYREERFWRPEDRAWLSSAGVAHPRFWHREGGEWYWRGMFELVPLPPSWPVYVTWAEACAFARWRGMRLPTEPEFHRAAYGGAAAVPGARAQPPGNYDFVRWDPVAVASYPDGATPEGVYDLVGNGWEWTSTVFAPFAGFTVLPSYPEYSADFFDGDHYVMKGASPVTARELVRPGFRNWFRPRYPHVYAAFRCAAAC